MVFALSMYLSASIVPCVESDLSNFRRSAPSSDFSSMMALNFFSTSLHISLAEWY